MKPTYSPSKVPTTSVPSSVPSRSPTTARPSVGPTTSKPTSSPTKKPTKGPSTSPTTSTPTRSPSRGPSRPPTNFPTGEPSIAPTFSEPTASPTSEPTTSPTVNLTILTGAVTIQQDSPWWLWVLIALLAYLLCVLLLLCCFYRERRRRLQKEKEEEERRRRLKEAEFKDLEKGAEPIPVPVYTVVPTPPVAVVEDPKPVVEQNELIQVPLDPPSPVEKDHIGSVGLLWGGNTEDVSLDLTSEQRSSRNLLRRRSERFTREQLVDVLSQRSFTMPTEQVVEGEGTGIYEDGQEEDSEDVSKVNSTAISDPAMSYHEAPSAVNSVNVDNMSIKELKSFIVENGGELEGCVEKDQLLARAKELA
jgi:hypothetical protein